MPGPTYDFFLFGVIDFPIRIIYKGALLKDRNISWAF